MSLLVSVMFFFFQAEDGIRDYKVTGVQTCALPIYGSQILSRCLREEGVEVIFGIPGGTIMPLYDEMHKHAMHHVLVRHEQADRKSTRLNSSHLVISYAVFCLKKKKKKKPRRYGNEF